jgi:glutamine kinase
MYPGAFHTEANVQTNSEESISTAIEKVIASYARHYCYVETARLDEVLVQRQVVNPLLSGIIMSHNHDFGAPYYLFEFDDETGRTDQVTGGYFCKKACVLRREIKIPFKLQHW